MGAIHHSAILMTTFDPIYFKLVEDWIQENVPIEYHQLFVTIPGTANGYSTMVFAPNGSKVGWPEADKHSKICENLIDFLDSLAYKDDEDTIEHDHPHENCIKWVEVRYGEHGQEITGNCPDYR